jgi:hypothetical protein
MVYAGYIAWKGTVWKEPAVAQFKVPFCHVLVALRKPTKPSTNIVCVAQITKGHNNYTTPPKLLGAFKLTYHGRLQRHLSSGLGELKLRYIVSTLNSFQTSTWHIYMLQQDYSVIVCWETAYQLTSPSYSINKYVGKRHQAQVSKVNVN